VLPDCIGSSLLPCGVVAAIAWQHWFEAMATQINFTNIERKFTVIRSVAKLEKE